MAGRRREGVLGVYSGASRQGKTHQLKKRIKGARRACVWSVKESVDRYADTWPDAVIIKGGVAELRAALFAGGGKGRGRFVFVPWSLRDFGPWAMLCHAWGIVEPCDVVAEELADVTKPGKAPDGWGELVRQGLGWGINIYAVTQRPAESDKTIMGNATYFHVHFMARESDRRYMAREMDVTPEAIKALRQYEWIERWNNGQIKKGR